MNVFISLPNILLILCWFALMDSSLGGDLCRTNSDCVNPRFPLCIHKECLAYKSYRDSCISDVQCNGSGLGCYDNVCKCSHNFRWLRTGCVSYDVCDYDYDCNAGYRCSNRRCYRRGLLGWQICLIVMGGLCSFIITISVLRHRKLKRQRQRVPLLPRSATTMSNPSFVYVNTVSQIPGDQTVGSDGEATRLPAYDPPPSYFATQQAKHWHEKENKISKLFNRLLVVVFKGI